MLEMPENIEYNRDIPGFIATDTNKRTPASTGNQFKSFSAKTCQNEYVFVCISL
jgi:hypothetical protein